MEDTKNQMVYLAYGAAAIAFFYYLGPILTPFLLGVLLAYLMKPLADWFESKKLPHIVSVVLVFLLLLCLITVLTITIYPMISYQLIQLINMIPKIYDRLGSFATTELTQYIDLKKLQNTISSSLPQASTVLNTIVSSSQTLLLFVINLFLTPIITFYLLRDWSHIQDKLKEFVPSKIKKTVLKFANDFDEILSAFFRGQLLVMLCLALLYGVGFAVTGLRVGLVIGVIAGLLSIVPYLGSGFALLAGLTASYVEYGTAWHLVAIALVFMVGQMLESYVLTPNLIGKRIGLHPVAVIFAVMAGSSLFGFFGILLALPVAAFIAVIIRHLAK